MRDMEEMMKISLPKGTKDILPEEMKKWNYVERGYSSKRNVYIY